MSSLSQEISYARHMALEQAYSWLYRAIAHDAPSNDIETWRATCFAHAFQKFKCRSSKSRLLYVWETAFDRAIRNSVDLKSGRSPTITRAMMTEDIWFSGGLDRHAKFLARAGEVVNIQGSPFREYPITVIPRSGTPFCAKASQLVEIATEELPIPNGGAK